MPGQAYKECTDCGELKPLEGFYRNRGMSDGRLRQCKPCFKARERKRFAANPDLVLAGRERAAAWNRENPSRRRETLRAWEARHPEKHRAHTVLRKAVRAGHISKPTTCEGCDGEFEKRLIHGHHHDYSKPLEVEWLCPSCHERRHHAV